VLFSIYLIFLCIHVNPNFEYQSSTSLVKHKNYFINMTLVFGTKEVKGLQQINFGVNELVSALTLSKQVGSLFSRKQDAQVFNVLQESYGMSVSWLPPWLMDFSFARATSIHGSDMRTVEGPLLMQDVELGDIEGIATVIVLIAEYV